MTNTNEVPTFKLWKILILFFLGIIIALGSTVILSLFAHGSILYGISYYILLGIAALAIMIALFDKKGKYFEPVVLMLSVGLVLLAPIAFIIIAVTKHYKIEW